MIENFTPQSWPLWCVYAFKGEDGAWKGTESVVVGWASVGDELTPVITLGTEAVKVRQVFEVRYFESRAEAVENIEIVVEAFSRCDNRDRPRTS